MKREKLELNQGEVNALLHLILSNDDQSIGGREWAAIHHQAQRVCSAGVTLPIIWDTPLHPVNDCEDHPADCKLLGTLTIGGVFHHIEAWEVHEVEPEDAHTAQFVQEAVCPENCNYDDVVNHMTAGAGKTVEINGRTYFVVVTPFQE